MGKSYARRSSWDDVERDTEPTWEPIRRRAPRQRDGGATGATGKELRGARRPETDVFRCRHCRAMVGPTLSGGRHRNHCPFCLHSRHVDDTRPGDRASHCRATMAPVGQFARASGELVILHRCLGCGFERHTRVAADDNAVVLMRLPLVERPVAHEPEEDTATPA